MFADATPPAFDRLSAARAALIADTPLICNGCHQHVSHQGRGCICPVLCETCGDYEQECRCVECNNCGKRLHRSEAAERSEEIYLGRHGTVLVCAEGCS